MGSCKELSVPKLVLIPMTLPANRGARVWSEHRQVLRAAARLFTPRLMITAAQPHGSIPLPWVDRVKSFSKRAPGHQLLCAGLAAKLYCLVFPLGSLAKLRYNSYSEIRLESKERQK